MHSEPREAGEFSDILISEPEEILDHPGPVSAISRIYSLAEGMNLHDMTTEEGDSGYLY